MQARFVKRLDVLPSDDTRQHSRYQTKLQKKSYTECVFMNRVCVQNNDLLVFFFLKKLARISIRKQYTWENESEIWFVITADACLLITQGVGISRKLILTALQGRNTRTKKTNEEFHNCHASLLPHRQCTRNACYKYLASCSRRQQRDTSQDKL